MFALTCVFCVITSSVAKHLQSEATDKFRQLQKRENTIDEFMTSFSDTKIQEMQEQSQLQGSIVALLEQISKTIEFGQNVPSQDRLQALKVRTGNLCR